jgi:hypothetical protein
MYEYIYGEFRAWSIRNLLQRSRSGRETLANGENPPDLNQHPNSPVYRLILNNVLFPSAKRKKAENVIGLTAKA